MLDMKLDARQPPRREMQGAAADEETRERRPGWFVTRDKKKRRCIGLGLNFFERNARYGVVEGAGCADRTLPSAGLARNFDGRMRPQRRGGSDGAGPQIDRREIAPDERRILFAPVRERPVMIAAGSGGAFRLGVTEYEESEHFLASFAASQGP